MDSEIADKMTDLQRRLTLAERRLQVSAGLVCSVMCQGWVFRPEPPHVAAALPCCSHSCLISKQLRSCHAITNVQEERERSAALAPYRVAAPKRGTCSFGAICVILFRLYNLLSGLEMGMYWWGKAVVSQSNICNRTPVPCFQLHTGIIGNSRYAQQLRKQIVLASREPTR